MNSSFAEANRSESRILLRAAALAFVIESLLLTLAGWNNHWLVHPQKTTGLDTSKFVEAQILEVPKVSQLTSEKETTAPHREATISKLPGVGRKAKPDEGKLEEKNETQGQGSLGPTHGPVVVYNPPPVIPTYLRSSELNTSVVIEFFITAQGNLTPRLLSSSGDEELDAIALNSVKKWQFRPAEQDHKPIDARVRLRIQFEVK